MLILLQTIVSDTILSDTISSVIASDIKPYLRPISSMNDEERLVYLNLTHDYTNKTYKEPTTEIIDWLNEHHFDYRGLIEKGLALEAPEDMYKKGE